MEKFKGNYRMPVAGYVLGGTGSNKIPIVCIQTGQIFPCLQLASKTLGVSKSAISRNLREDDKTKLIQGKYSFEYHIKKSTFIMETKQFPDSKQIESASYTKETKTLIVVFRSNGTRYSYANVPENKWEELKKAESVGRFINTNIKGHHSYTKLE